MSKDYREKMSVVWVYRVAENPAGTASTSGGVSMPFDSGSFMNFKRTTVDDADEIAGREGAYQLYRTAHSAEGALKQVRARPDFILWTLAFFLGEAHAEQIGDSAYKHIITPLAAPEHPSFTLCQRRGESVMKERFIHNYVKSFTLSLADGWATMEAGLIGSGNRETNYAKEIVSAAENANELTLAENAVEGGNGAERLENVRLVRTKRVGDSKWTYVAVSEVSADEPAVLTITPVGSSSELIDYEVYYHPREAEHFTPPTALSESPLRLSSAKIILDGDYDGSSFGGGLEVGHLVSSFEIKGENDIALEHAPDGGGALHATQGVRRTRSIGIKLGRRFKDIVRQVHADDNELISLMFSLRGAEIPGAGGERFGVELIFPRVGISESALTTKDGLILEECELKALVHPLYGMCVATGFNCVPGYL